MKDWDRIYRIYKRPCKNANAPLQPISSISVTYDGQEVGEYYPDLWVDERVLIELKAIQMLVKQHEVQLVNYLTATKIDCGLLLNFGPSVQVKRKFREYNPKTPLINSIL